MDLDSEIIGLSQWWSTPAGQYVLGWEQSHLDELVSNIFGFHALQLGCSELNALQANRIPHRWLATEGYESATYHEPSGSVVSLQCDFLELPFPSQSLDLVVLPHTLEMTLDPHLALREVERVLVPEGRVIVLGFNPYSFWGLRQFSGHALRRIGLLRDEPSFLPSDEGAFIAYRRLRDWLRLLDFEVDQGRFGCYRLPLSGPRWLDRMAWMDRAGDRSWPFLGAAYILQGIKRVRGMRLVGLARSKKKLKERLKNPLPAPTSRQKLTEDNANHHKIK